MHSLGEAVQYIHTTSAGVWDDQEVSDAVRTLKGEGHMTNVFEFLGQLHTDSVDFSHDPQLQSTMNNEAVVLGAPPGPSPFAPGLQQL